MLNIGRLKELVRHFISLIIDNKTMTKDDIRLLKDSSGTFPLKLIYKKDGTVDKSTPYLVNSDTFIMFDVIQKRNLAQTEIGDYVVSMVEFDLEIDIYGANADTQAAYILSGVGQYEVSEFLNDVGMSITVLPENIEPLDSFNNAEWWIRRRLTFEMNAEQRIKRISNEKFNDLELIDIGITKERIE